MSCMHAHFYWIDRIRIYIGDFASTLWKQVEVYWREAARFICGVPVRTPIGALFGDLDWYAFRVRALHQAACFWTRVTRMDDALIVRQAMHVQKGLLRRSKSVKHACWLSRLREALCEYPIGTQLWNTWENTVDFRLECMREVLPSSPSDKLRLIPWECDLLDNMISVENHSWLSDISAVRADEINYAVSDNLMESLPIDNNVRSLHVGNNNKLRTYSLFKVDRGALERYLICIPSVPKRQALSRFRMGVSSLRIETGRYESNGTNGTRGIPVGMRICKCCDLCKVEDEIHFLLECPLYHTLRQSLFLASSEFIEFNGRSVLENFISLMSDDHDIVIRALADYLWRAHKLRRDLLDGV